MNAVLYIVAHIRRVFASEFLGKVVDFTFSNSVPSGGLRIRTDNPAIGRKTAAELFFHLYERNELALIRKSMLTEYDVLELGAGIGVTGAHILHRLKPGRRLISVEANADLLPTLRNNLDCYRGSCEAVTLHGAVSYFGSEVVTLHQCGDHTASKISSALPQDRPVRAYTLSELVKDNFLTQYVLVSDIEGIERDLIAQDVSALESCQQLIIELHGSSADMHQMSSNLSELGFELTASRKSVFTFTRPVRRSRKRHASKISQP